MYDYLTDDYLMGLAREARRHIRIETTKEREYTETEYRIHNEGSSFSECSIRTICETYIYTMKAERYY